MIALPEILAAAASRAGIALPDDLRNYEPTAFPHWHLLQIMQLGQPMSPGAHWQNAEVIAKVEKPMEVTLQELVEAGFTV